MDLLGPDIRMQYHLGGEKQPEKTIPSRTFHRAKKKPRQMKVKVYLLYARDLAFPRSIVMGRDMGTTPLEAGNVAVRDEDGH